MEYTHCLSFVEQGFFVLVGTYFQKLSGKSGCALYTGAHYTRVNRVHGFWSDLLLQENKNGNVQYYFEVKFNF